MSIDVCLLFGDQSGVPGKEVEETEGAPTARRYMFFATAIRNCTICSEMQLL